LITAQQANEFIRTRRSVRRFQPQRISEQTVRRILETATWAPSAHNRQPWRFAILAGVKSRGRLVDAMGTEFLRDLLADGLSSEEAAVQVERSRSRILEAPLAVLLCLDESEMDNYPDERRQDAEYIMAVQGVAMAGQNLLLAAHAEGLGSVWMCAPLFVPEVVRKSLSLPGSWRPQGLVLLGYPGIGAPVRPRLSVEEVSVKID